MIKSTRARSVFGDLDEVDEPGFRERGKKLDATGFERVVNELRVLERYGHGSRGKVRIELLHGEILRQYASSDKKLDWQ